MQILLLGQKNQHGQDMICMAGDAQEGSILGKN
jgi:hypothetical protein